MKILHIKVNSLIDAKRRDELKSEIEKDLKKGILITDELIEVEVLEVDIDE